MFREQEPAKPGDRLHEAMVAACDRLLRLLTGPQALTDPAAMAAALEAIELLQTLEGYLKGAADDFVMDEQVLERLAHRTAVLNHVAEVLSLLRARGLSGPRVSSPAATDQA